MNFKLMAKTTGMAIKKHAPEILTVVGIGAIGTGVVLACVNTHKKLDSTLAKNTAIWTDLNMVKEHKDEYVDYDEKAYRKDVIKAAGNTAWDFCKIYGVPLLLVGSGIACLCSATGIYRKRYLVSAAAAEGALMTLNKYRENVRKKLGDEADKEFLYGFEKVLAKKQVVDKETGETKEVEEEVTIATNHSPFTRLFSEENCPLTWGKWDGYNLSFITTMQCQLNDRLKRENYLYLKDVLQALGFANPTLIIDGKDVSATYGWVHCMERQDKIDFGFSKFDGYSKDEIEGKVNFLMEEENNVWLDFNVSGDITKIVPELMYREAARAKTLPWDETPNN